MLVKRNSAADSPVLGEAARLFNRGLSIFPVSTETKKPLIEWGRLQDSLPTVAEITNWFTPENRAIGVACGPVSDLFCLDFDFAKHPEAREFFENNQHRIPRTWKEETGSGGWHIYFRWCDALNAKQTNTTSKLWRGVDTKGYGGYSKIAPSPGYKWLIPPHMAPLAMCPQWLIDALPNREKREVPDTFKQKPEDWMIRELESVDPKDPINGRTPTFCRAIGRLKSRGLTVLETKTFLLPYAQRYQYPNILGLVEDQFHRYPPKVETHDLNDHSLKSFLEDVRPIPFIVPGLIGLNTINVMAGLPESRKSWLLLDLAVALASGTMWMDKFLCERKKVLIFDQERDRLEMQRRVHALVTARGLSIDSLEGNLIPKVGTTFKINHDASYDSLKTLIGALKPEVLLIDSLKTFQSGNVKEDSDMQRVFERFKELRRDYGVTIVILHHENKGAYAAIREKQVVTGEKVAGSGVINEVPDGIFIIRNFEADSSIFHHNKNSYGTKLAPFTVKVRDVTPDRSQIAVEAF